MARKGSDFLTGFMQGFNQAGGMQRVSNWAAKKSGSYDVFQDPFAMQAYSRARQIGTPAAQQEFVDKYGQYVDTQEGTTPTEMFFGKEDPTYLGMNKGQFLNTAVQALSSGAWDENEFGNIMAGASEAYGEDLTNNPFLSAFMQEQPDMKTKFLNDRWTQAAFDGNEFAQNLVSQEYGDFLSNYVDQLDPEQLAAMVMADEQLTPEEQEVWNNSPYSPFGSPENFIPQPEQERLIDLGALGLPGGEVPIDDANKLMGILNTALNYRKFNQPQGQDYGPMINGAPFGVEGQIPLKYGSDYAALIRAMNGGGPGAGSVDISQWPIINYDEEGPIRRNPDTGFLMRDATIPYVNKDGQLVQAIGDEEMGYQYQYHDTFVQPQGGGGGGELLTLIKILLI
jgi:hypothetical protein